MRDRLDRIRHPTKIPQTGPANTWGGSNILAFALS